jgi:hypothetical protein
MSTSYRVKLAALAASTTALAALTVLEPTRVLATNCGGQSFCQYGLSTCPNQSVVDAACRSYTPPGCTYVSGFCAPNPNCGSGSVAFFCNYK